MTNQSAEVGETDILKEIADSIRDYGMACALHGDETSTVALKAYNDAMSALRGVITPLRAKALRITSAEESANKLRFECHAAAFVAGWWQVPGFFHVPGKVDVREYPSHVLQWWVSTKIALMHSELSEALEGLRKDEMDRHLPHLKSIDVELADAVIRIMDLCGGLNIDIGRAITEKLAYNAQRADHKPENRDKAGGKAF